jgi:hypothetical protein
MEKNIPLHLVNQSLQFDIWAIDFVRRFPTRDKSSGEKYIITRVDYLTKWAEHEPVENCTKEKNAKFFYENIITRFGFPLKIINDQGTQFINTIEIILINFLIDHIKINLYHLKSNIAVESFNKTLHKGLTKICGLSRDD